MRPYTRGLVEVHLAVLLFGLAGIFGKLLTLPSTIIVLGRVVFAALSLLVILISSRREIELSPRSRYRFMLLTGLLLAIHWTTFFQSIQVSSVAVGLISFSTFPVFVTFLEPYFFKERLRSADMLTALVTVAGVALVVPALDPGNSVTQGVLWGVVSALTFALLSLLNKTQVREQSSLTIAFYQDASASLLLLPFLFITRPAITARDLSLLVVLGVVFTALSHALFIDALRYLKAQTASVIASLEPLYGIAFASVLLSETPGVRTVLGGVVILGAALSVSLRKS